MSGVWPVRTGRTLFTSESVTEGHPDKICDQISDAVLDYCLAKTPSARVACEASIKSVKIGSAQHDNAVVFGEITPRPTDEEIREIVRATLARIGYIDPSYGTSAQDIRIEVWLSEQAPDISAKVNSDDPRNVGAGDQGMMFGFACRETDVLGSNELMPLPITLAHRLCRRLAEVRKQHVRQGGPLSYLGPDGKSQVTVEYGADWTPLAVHTVVVSTQHRKGIRQDQIRVEIEREVIRNVIPAQLLTPTTQIHVNPGGPFDTGGPLGDSGLTGRKIIVDTYGAMARHGGGAFSGKDPTKVDRSGSYAARWVAKNVVAAGLATRCEIQLAYAIGLVEPINVSVQTFDTETVSIPRIERAIAQVFDLRPGAIIEALRLRRPIYGPTAAYGHFGRTDIDASWEDTSHADALQATAQSS